MALHEPATLVTDILLGAFSGWLALRLWRKCSAGNRAARWWSRTLALAALSALVGGAYHGFAPNFPAAVVGAWWRLTLILVCTTSAAMAMSLLHEAVRSGCEAPWIAAIAAKLVVFGGTAMVHPKFIVVIVDYGSMLVAWAVAAVVMRRAWAGWMLSGVAMSVVAAAVQQSGVSLSAHFNHNDLYHVIQALAVFGFYKAGKHLGPGPAANPAPGP